MDGLEDYEEEIDQLTEENILNQRTPLEILTVIMSIAAIIGICGCIYVIWLIFTSKCLNITNCYILNRSFADLLFLLTVPFIVKHTDSGSWGFGTFLCKVSIATTHGCGLASCFLLAALSINCYYTASGSWLSSARLFWFRFFLAVTWISVIIYAIPYLVFYGLWEFKSPFRTETHCTITHSFSASFYLHITNTLIVIVPMLISGYMTISICLLNTSRLGLLEEGAEARSGKKLTVVLTIMYAILNLPYALASLVHLIIPTYDENMVMVLFLIMPLPFVNSALDPFIYLRCKGDLLKPQQSETLHQEPSVALLASESDSLAIQII